MAILLTGSSGFVGKHFQKKIDCIPVVDNNGNPIDTRDFNKLFEFLKGNPANLVVHLAAKSFVPWSFKNPRETYEVNFFGTFNLITALKEIGFKGRMLYVGSADQYGLVPEGKLPIGEETLLKPRNPYSVSKAAAEKLCFQSSQTEEYEIVMARPFNHIGPGQDENFVISDFAKQIIEIKRGLREPVIFVGDIEVTRDFTDVRDVVDAYLMLLRNGKNGEVYNVCSGRECKISDLLNKLIELSGIEATIEKDSGKLRESEQKRMVGSYKKIKNELGWEPCYSIEKTFRDILEYWEGKINE